MGYDPDSHHRRSIRLREYDYSTRGAYFVTICTQGRECLFGDVRDGEICMNAAGRMIEAVWQELPGRFPQVTLDEYVIMPNHFHGIVVIDVGAIHESPYDVDDNGAINGAIHELPLRVRQRSMLIPKVVGYFKMNTAKQINIWRDNTGVPVWQRNYYERIIRNEQELAAIREYIVGNPQRWAKDKENPDS